MRRFFAIAAVVLASAALPASSPGGTPTIVIANVTLEATGPTGADGSYHVSAHDPETGDPGDPVEVTCDYPLATPATDPPTGISGNGDFDSPPAHFALDETKVITCTAADGTSGSGNVKVEDHTPPSFVAPDINVSDGTSVSYSSLSATDLVDGTITSISCSPASGSTFTVGTTPVTCSAADARGNSAEAHFNVIVADTEAPEFSSTPSPMTVEATGSTGATVTFEKPVATDNVGTPTVVCAPASGSTFQVGTTSVTCTATDGSANSTTTSFGVTVQDTTPPSLTVPSNQPVETESPAGKNVTFTATASDLVDGAVTPSCDPASGSLFPVGTTTVHCTATDAAGKASSADFTVTVSIVDHTAPVLNGVPSKITREADGPLGSIVTYNPSAVDGVDGPVPVICAPVSGTKFALGSKSVSCEATDAANNKRTESFTVKVVDTTEPVLTVPGDVLVYASNEEGISGSDSAVVSFLNSATATDIVDKTLTITNDAPGFFPVGATLVTFSTTDDAGNTAESTAAIVVFPLVPDGDGNLPPLPGGGGTKDRTPPDNVKNLAATPGSGKITLSWTKPSAADFDHVTITRTLADGTETSVVYTGKGTSFVDAPLQDGIEYRYTVVSFDASGNRSAGAVITTSPGRALLLAPRDGARIKSTKTIRLSWARVPQADYYNVQLYFVSGLKANSLSKGVAETKVLSVWPKKNLQVLSKKWKFAGKRRQLRTGVYHWYVWAGFGNRKDVNYGPVMGRSTFVVVR